MVAKDRIFVSHSSADRIWCQEFVQELRRHGYDVWYDESSLKPGDNWTYQIQQELLSRDIFLLIVTPDSWRSLWVQREFILALQKGKRIIPVLAKPTTLSGFVELYQFADVIGLQGTVAAQRLYAILLADRRGVNVTPTGSGMLLDSYFSMGLLGFHGVGKSCFAVGMYNALRAGVGGYTLNTVDPDRAGYLRDAWIRMCAGGEDRFPEKTSDLHDVDFELRHAAVPIAKFHWMDYPGGTLLMPEDMIGDDPSIRRIIQEILEHCSRSSCLILCIDSSDVFPSRPYGKYDGRETRASNHMRIVRLACQTLLPTADRPLPIALVLTKYDVLLPRQQKALLKEVIKLYSGLFERENSILTSFIPISLGLNLSSNRTEAPIEPFQMHLPVLFCIWAQLRVWVREASETISLMKQDHRVSPDRIRFMELELAGAAREKQSIALQLRSLDSFLEGRKVDLSRF